MKSAGEILHKTPWWALVLGGLALVAGLAAFVTPFRLIGLEKAAATAEEKRAIKREINNTFAEGAMDFARGIGEAVRAHTHDEAGRQELDRALRELDQARETVRREGLEALRGRVAQAEAVAAAKRAQQAAEPAESAEKNGEPAAKNGEPAASGRPGTDGATTGSAEAEAQPAPRRRGKHHIKVTPGPAGPSIDIEIPEAPAGVVAPLPPERREQIRDKVRADLYRIGVGAGLTLILIPLFVIMVIAKIFIDRSRAAQRLAELQRKEAEYQRMSRQVTEAKLSALQAQVEPHFLYNTLASVQALTEIDPARANAMTGHLIQYLRNALPKMRESGSTIGQEVELVRAYLNILQMRMGARLAFEILVPAELLDIPFPPLMLPSLVENAIKHGLEPQREGGQVTITASAIDGKVRVVVADTGRGFGETPGQGVGLANIRERLAALYGEAAKLTLEAREPRGVLATIEVPRQGMRPGAAAGAAAPARPEAPKGPAARTLAAVGTAERVWRRGLSFAFVVLVCVAAVLAGLGIVGVAAGIIPINVGAGTVGGPTGALIGTGAIAAAFAVVVLGLAIVLAVVYGLGFLFVGLAIFIPLVILISLFPVLAPFVLVGLAIWWLIRRSERRAARASASSAAPPPAAPPQPGPPPAAPPGAP